MKIRVIPAIALATLMASHFARACDYQATPLECINVLDPALVKELVWGPGPTHCGEEMSSFWFNRVSGWGFDVPAGGGTFDAAGNLYTLDNWSGPREVFRYKRDGTRELIAVGALDGPVGLSVDATAGRIYLSVLHGGCDGSIIALSGLPTMFDTLLTFIPSQQAMNIQTPAHPDGFRSADSLQVWTGNVRSMPDWSQAQPLACSVATSPVPGQVVTVSDGLSDPAVGHGRYYLVASQCDPGRKLGSLDGTVSMRTPAGLPICQ